MQGPVLKDNAQSRQVVSRPGVDELNITIGGREVVYRGLERAERAIGEVHPLLFKAVSDPSRNIRQELIEISDELVRSRLEILENHLPRISRDKCAPIGWDFDSKVEDALGYTRALETARADAIEKGTYRRTPQMAALEQHLETLGSLHKRIADAACGDAEVLRNSAICREAQTARALQTINACDEPIGINLYVGNQIAGGVMGTATLMAEALAHASTKLKPRIYIMEGQAKPDGFDFGLQVRHREERLKDALLHVGVHTIVESFAPKGSLISRNNPMPNVQHEASLCPYVLKDPVSNNLREPHGTVILDKGLWEGRKQRDTWNEASFVQARSAWFMDHVAPAQREALYRIEKKDGWLMERAVWSFGYFQDAGAFKKELSTLSSYLKNGGSLPVVSQGNQVVLHLVPGKHSRPPLTVSDLTSMGCTVVSPDGTVASPWFFKKIPVTVVMHSSLPNKAIRDLQSKLTGTLVRNISDTFYLDFPSFVTGSASWLEGVSSAAITLHDNFDTNPNRKRDILENTIVRSQVEHDGESLQALKAKASASVEAYLMGGSGHEQLYSNLERWTEQARHYTEGLYRFNSIDDLLIGIAQELERRKKRGGE